MDADIIVIGGGAAGLTAAISAAERLPGARVMIAEKLDRTGKKLLATGNGRCNLSNSDLSAGHYHGSFDTDRIFAGAPGAAEFFGQLGVLLITDSQGRIYPRSESAATVLNALRERAKELEIAEKCGFELTSYSRIKGGFRLCSASGEELNCKRLIIAAGGYAAPSFGTDGRVLRMLKEKGYKTGKICPAVAPLRVPPELLKGMKGVRLKGVVSAFSGEKILGSERGEIQFTENSLSGICVFNMAHFFQKYEGKLELLLDLTPDMDKEQIIAYLRGLRRSRGERPISELLTGLFAKNPALHLLKRAGLSPSNGCISAISNDDILRIVQTVKSLTFPVTGCSPWQNAQATCGGVHKSCVNSQFESVTEKGIFFAGEILDTDGDCGGYNLQWAWTTGIIAGRACADSLSSSNSTNFNRK